MMEDAPVFLALTKPAERGGLPMGFWIIIGSVPAVVFLVTQGFFNFPFVLVPALASALTCYLVARRIARVDPYLPDHLSARVDCNLFTRSTSRWGGNSYAGD